MWTLGYVTKSLRWLTSDSIPSPFFFNFLSSYKKQLSSFNNQILSEILLMLIETLIFSLTNIKNDDRSPKKTLNFW